jgi:hypothetical protein
LRSKLDLSKQWKRGGALPEKKSANQNDAGIPR